MSTSGPLDLSTSPVLLTLELEREKGTLMYSFDLKVPVRSGIDEVNVDAKTGAVLHVEHEGPAQEKREAAADAKEAKAKSAARKA